MKFTGEVMQLSHRGNEAEVKIGNVRRDGSASWREYGPSISLYVPLGQAEFFSIGREVSVTVSLKRKP